MCTLVIVVVLLKKTTNQLSKHYYYFELVKLQMEMFVYDLCKFKRDSYIYTQVLIYFPCRRDLCHQESD